MGESYAGSDSVKEMLKLKISRRVRDGELEVPVLPHVAQRTLGMIGNPNVNAKDLENLIVGDQQLTARLLKIANSPVYSGTVEIKSIQRAIVSIGLSSLRDMVFSVAMGEKIFRSKRFGPRMEKLWAHSLATGLIAREIAKIKGLDSEFAFLCGLLHDVGKPLLLETMEQIHRRFQDKVLFEDVFVDEILREFHEVVGALMARSWNFSSTLVTSIHYHHNLKDAGDFPQNAQLTQAANLFAHYLGFESYASEDPFDIKQQQVLYQLNMFPDEIKSLVHTMPKKCHALIDSMS